MTRNLIRICLATLSLCSSSTAYAQPVTKLAAGWYHSLLLKSDGSLSAMGWNLNGQLGDGSANNTNRPKRVVTSGVTAIAGGLYHTLFLKSDASLWVMGNNGWGQLGDGTFNQTNLPEQIVTNVIAIAAGSQHSLFLKSNGSLWAMGWNYDGELGNGGFSTNAPYGFATPQCIVASNVTAIAAGQFHSLFLKDDGSLWAMGDNAYGQLGDGTYDQTNRPELIVSYGVKAIAAGDNHSLFLKDDGSLWAMGNNYYGQLGDGTYNFNPPFGTNRPEQIMASNVTAIAAGNAHSLLVKKDGSLWGMGNNGFGQLGSGVSNYTNEPVLIEAGGVSTMIAGHYYSLFLKCDGTFWAMGYNGVGQLGDGTQNNTSQAELILGTYNQIVSQRVRDGNMLFSFVGVAGTNYMLERSCTLAPNSWQPQVTNPADSSGALHFTNLPIPGTNNFWRIRSVP